MDRTLMVPLTLLQVLVLIFAACGSGGSAEPTPPQAECLRDLDCNDLVDCSDDVCGLTINGGRKCEHSPNNAFCDAGAECLIDSALGSGCFKTAALWCANREEGAPCVAQDLCALGNPVCKGGDCTFERKECAPSVCLDSQGCDATTGQCQTTPKPDGTSCESNDLSCSQNECQDGKCVVVTNSCECGDENPCKASTDLCVKAPSCVDGTCVYSPVVCQPDEECRKFTCDPADGACVPNPIREGESCDDGLACTGPDKCTAGVCIGGPVIVCQQEPCKTSTCVEPVGCVLANIPDSTSCNNGNLCDGLDQCSDGQCLGVGPIVECNDGDSCTQDQCRPADGGCDHITIPNCCGNGILEAGELCDPGHIDVPLCAADCKFMTGDLSLQGRNPAVVWWTQGNSGLVALQEVDEGGMPILTVRKVAANGSIGAVIVVPGVNSDVDDVFRPALAVLPDGKFLLAFYDPPALGLRLLDADGAVLGTHSIPDAVSSGADGPGDNLKLGALDGLFMVAWTVKHVVSPRTFQEIRATWVNLVNDKPMYSFPKSLTGHSVAAPVNNIMDSLCMGRGGGLVTMLTRANSQARNRSAFLGTDAVEQPVIDLDQNTSDFTLPPHCGLRGEEGFWTLVSSNITVGDSRGVQCSTVTLDQIGQAPGPANILAQSLFVQGAPFEMISPSLGRLVPWGVRQGFVTLWTVVGSDGQATDLVLKAHDFSAAGTLVGDPLPVEGATAGFAMSLDATNGPEGAMLIAWDHQEVMASSVLPGTVRMRFLAPP